MDPTLTRAAAHKVFGDLYRKSRSTEAQAEVDKIIQSTNDVFVRIQRIEQIDAGQAGKTRGVETAGTRPSRPAQKVAPAPVRKPPASPGILGNLFGGDIPKWGKETETLSSGFLGRNLKLSKKGEEVFTNLSEDVIVATLKSLRIAMRDGWTKWEPATYNVVVATFQFFSEFINVGSTLRRVEKHDNLMIETLKMQKMYAHLIQYANYKKVITDPLIKFISEHKDTAGTTEIVRATMNYVANLEARNPTLKNTILAFYALSRKKVPTWAEVTTELGAVKPITNRYRAPEAVMGVIQAAIKKYTTQISMKEAEIHEINTIKQKFFEYDASGRVKTEFLNKILDDALRRIYPDKMVNELTVKAHKSEPPKLLYVIMKDFDVSSLFFLESSFQVKEVGGGHTEMILFKQGLFRAMIDEFNATLREVEGFVKKYKNMSFHFQNFIEILKTEPSDEDLRRFIALSKKANKIFKAFGTAFRAVLDNHNSAKHDNNPQSQEKLARTKTIPIESFAIGKRYLPFHDREMMSGSRYNGVTIEAVIQEVVRNFYNYLFIFRDEELLSHLTSVGKIEEDIKELKAILLKLGVDYDETHTHHS